MGGSSRFSMYLHSLEIVLPHDKSESSMIPSGVALSLLSSSSFRIEAASSDSVLSSFWESFGLQAEQDF